jgi:hypothetical protein
MVIALGWSRVGREWICGLLLWGSCKRGSFRVGPGFDVRVRLAAVMADDFSGTWDSGVKGYSGARKRDDRSYG